MYKMTQTYIVLEPKEIKVVEQCLRYALHRLKKHTESGIQKVVKQSEIEKLLKEYER